MRKRAKKFENLSQEIRNCRKCRLWKTRTNAIPGEGNISSELMLIAQAPGYEEGKKGKMFVGPPAKS